MDIRQEDLKAASKKGILQQDQIKALWDFLEQHRSSPSKNETPRFSGTHILYYLGGLLAISAASLFATLAIESMGMSALFMLTLLYGACALAAALWFEKRGFGIPASIFATLVIALAPLAVFALQHLLGLWPEDGIFDHYQDYHAWVDWRWLFMELATLLVGVLMLMRFKYPFLMLPIAFTLWYLGMDIIPALIFDANTYSDGWFDGSLWEFRKKISLVFGFLMLLFAFYVDIRSRHTKDYAFWLYLFGLMTFWGTLSSMGTGALSGKLIYLLINFVLVFIGAILIRRTFAVFGGMGIVMVLGDLSWNMFQDSFAFVAVLTLLGFALIGTGIWWSKHEKTISAKMRAFLPQNIRELIEARAAS